MNKRVLDGHIYWVFDPRNPIVRPGQLIGDLDSRRAGAAHILSVGARYRMYYWETARDGYHRICAAESSKESSSRWQSLGVVLERQPGTEYNHFGPGFPFVVPRDDGPWLMYFGAWGKARKDGKLPNTTGLALSFDRGLTWQHWSDRPVLSLDRHWDSEGTGSVCVLHEGDRFRMYYTALGQYFQRPDGVQTGHGDFIPWIGVGYAESSDGVCWEKPLDDLAVSPRGFGTEPYEYIASKPFVLREESGYRMWVNTFGHAYRVRSLVSADGIHWEWIPSGPDGDFGVGEPGAFDDHQRSYVSALLEGSQYHVWYTGNGFGATGIGHATGTPLADEHTEVGLISGE